MKVETVPLTTLTPDPLNARKHSKRNLDAIAASLSKFGQRKPIVVTHEGVVIAGNGTLEAASSLNWTEIFIARAPKDWDENTVRAYALADNQTGALAEWDDEVLNTALEELTSGGWDIAELGFDLNIDVTEPLNGDLDDVPDAPMTPKAQLGDIYQLGEHRLMCGDSTDVRNYGLLMQGEKADCIWTDPPYGVNYEGKTKEKLTIQNDNKGDLDMMLEQAFSCISEYGKEGAAIYVAHPAGALSLKFIQAFINAEWRLHQTLVWDKQTIVLGHSDYHYSHEPILFGYLPGGGRRGRGGEGWYGDNAQRSVLPFQKPSANKLHPTMKPIDLIVRCIENSSPKGAIVLDTFGGSGSTLIACETSGRKARLIELDPKYVDVIIARWETATGKTAVLL